MPNSSTSVFAYLVDGAPETAARSFGLGMTAKGTPIGAYQVRVDQATADGVLTDVIAGSHASGWSVSVPTFLDAAGAGTSYAVGTAGGPIAATNSVWSLRVLPTIAPKNALVVTGAETIDGSMTLTIVYP
jgi:hypothetical protein